MKKIYVLYDCVSKDIDSVFLANNDEEAMRRLQSLFYRLKMDISKDRGAISSLQLMKDSKLFVVDDFKKFEVVKYTEFLGKDKIADREEFIKHDKI